MGEEAGGAHEEEPEADGVADGDDLSLSAEGECERRGEKGDDERQDPGRVAFLDRDREAAAFDLGFGVRQALF